MSKYTFTDFTPSDLEEIAAVHALSWQRHYRNILSDSFLDHEVEKERLDLWTARFEKMSPKMHVITLRTENQLIGFSGVFLEGHEKYGAYIDNLHVLSEHQGHGLGRQLMLRTARWVQEQDENSMYLHVFDENLDAIRFYEKIDGIHAETKMVEVPSGAEHPVRIYCWDNIPKFLRQHEL